MSNQMSKHTPGPWFVTGNMTLYVEARIGGGLVQEVAAVGPTEADSGYGPQQRANADLIAAAPDLLRALECLLEMGHAKAGDLARAAIAKARGEV
ncbi:hypothetical protein [Stutzerimonas kunmingensis]|uniref:hypothetical protein n=1 Tax=Stutzerimonas kunmingensis TaxID=1211807 RepID=UPI00241FFE2F|nr:hypothetical protein [Stutzerimonas kunmingensis]